MTALVAADPEETRAGVGVGVRCEVRDVLGIPVPSDNACKEALIICYSTGTVTHTQTKMAEERRDGEDFLTCTFGEVW